MNLSKAKVYIGGRNGNGGNVIVTEGGQPKRALDPRYDLRNHSPDGFEWGYGGSGPAQLALALVADATGDDLMALMTYQDFKSAFVARWNHDAWSISADEIVRFVERVAA